MLKLTVFQFYDSLQNVVNLDTLRYIRRVCLVKNITRHTSDIPREVETHICIYLDMYIYR